MLAGIIAINKATPRERLTSDFFRGKITVCLTHGQFVTILSVNKTTGKDGRNAPFFNGSHSKRYFQR